MRGAVILTVLAIAAVARADAGADFYRAADLARDGHDREAAEAFRCIVDGAPGDPFADDALFELARLEEERLADPVAAARDFERLGRNYPSSRLAVRAERRAEALRQVLGPGARAADAAAEWGTIFYGFAGRPRAETIRMTEALLEHHPDFPDAAHASYWLATLDRDDGRTGEALARFSAVAAQPSAGEWAARARVAEGDLLIVVGDLDGATRAFAASAGPAAEEGLRRVAAERWRGWAVVAAWVAIVLSVAAAVVTVRRATGSFRALVRPPAETLYVLPVIGVFAAAAFTENAALGHAVQLICAGGLVATWLSGATLEALRARGPMRARRVLAHVAVVVTAVLSLTFIAVVRERLVDQLIETVRFGADR